jgi:hypothetical protein
MTMANMGYCRFRNTVSDMGDCIDHLWDKLSPDEHKARMRLIRMAHDIVDEVGKDDWLMDEDAGEEFPDD